MNLDNLEETRAHSAATKEAEQRAEAGEDVVLTLTLPDGAKITIR